MRRWLTAEEKTAEGERWDAARALDDAARAYTLEQDRYWQRTSTYYRVRVRRVDLQAAARRFVRSQERK
jgi:hypothetical protein